MVARERVIGCDEGDAQLLPHLARFARSIASGGDDARCRLIGSGGVLQAYDLRAIPEATLVEGLRQVAPTRRLAFVVGERCRGEQAVLFHFPLRALLLRGSEQDVRNWAARWADTARASGAAIADDDDAFRQWTNRYAGRRPPLA